MKKFKLSKEQLATVARVQEDIKKADVAKTEKETAHQKVMAETDAVQRAIDRFDRAGDFRDLQQVVENEARIKQVTLYSREVESAKIALEKAEKAVESALSWAATEVNLIGQEAYAFANDQIIELIKPFFMDEGKARIVVESQFDFTNNTLRWSQYFPRAKGNSVRVEIDRALANLANFGLPDDLGCQVWKAFGAKPTEDAIS